MNASHGAKAYSKQLVERFAITMCIGINPNVLYKETDSLFYYASDLPALLCAFHSGNQHRRSSAVLLWVRLHLHSGYGLGYGLGYGGWNRWGSGLGWGGWGPGWGSGWGGGAYIGGPSGSITSYPGGGAVIAGPSGTIVT